MRAGSHPADRSAQAPSHRARIWCAWLLAACLLGTQWLGLAHAIEHHPVLGGVSGAVFSTPAASGTVGSSAHRLHADHNCTLFDALALASCAGSPATPQVDLPAPHILVTMWDSSSCGTLTFAHYDPRGPPAIRN